MSQFLLSLYVLLIEELLPLLSFVFLLQLHLSLSFLLLLAPTAADGLAAKAPEFLAVNSYSYSSVSLGWDS